MNVKLTPAMVAMALAFLAFIVGAFVLLAALGKDTAGVTTLLVATIFPTVLAILNNGKAEATATAVSQVAVKQQETAAAVERVATQTNGTTSTLLDQVATLVDHLAAAPVTPEVRIAIESARARLAMGEEGRHSAPDTSAG